jgi:peptide/nickel transport system ATP-binding protein
VTCASCSARGPAAALRGVSFTMARGEKLGLIGEAAAASRSALHHGPAARGARIEGSIRLNGAELVGLADDAMARLRGDRVAMIFQEPMTALNPPRSAQVAEPLRLHRGWTAARRAPKRCACSIACGCRTPRTPRCLPAPAERRAAPA